MNTTASTTPSNVSLLDRLLRMTVDLMPLILVALLALTSWWLVRSTPDVGETKPPPSPTEPDYYMQDFRIRAFNKDGRLTQNISGEFGEHIPEGDQLRISKPHSFSLDKNGIETVAIADRSVSDSKGNDIHLYDNVRVVRTDPTPDPQGKPHLPVTLEGNYLHLVNRQEKITSDQPVRITQGKDVLTGDSLDYTSQNRTVTVDGRVRATIQPRADNNKP